MTHPTESPDTQLKPCGCGRSATGFCTGLHRLTEQEWDDLLLEKPTKTTIYVVEVKHDDATDDYYIELPPEVLIETGWQSGDELTWTDLGDQRWQLSKQIPQPPSTP